MYLQCLVYFVATLYLPVFVISATISDNNSTVVVHVSSERYNKVFSLAAEISMGNIGSSFVFYVSFVDKLFASTETIFEVTVKKNSSLQNACYCTEKERIQGAKLRYSNVQTFMHQFDEEGIYSIKVTPFSHTTKALDQTASLVLNVTVKSQLGSDCQHVGEFMIDDFAATSLFTNNFTRKKLTDWTVISSKGISCSTWRAKRPKWTIEKIHLVIPDPLGPLPCLNAFKIREVNISAYIAECIHIPLPVPNGESGFVIQPSTLPPGLFRICSTISDRIFSLKHCGYIGLVPEPGDCTPFTRAMRIEMTPKSDEFSWPVMNDLIINVTNHYNLHNLPEAGYMGHMLEGHTWLCFGDSLCKTLQTWGLYLTGDEFSTGIELSSQDTKLIIPKHIQKPGVSITLRFVTEYQDPLFDDFICRRYEERRVTFMDWLPGDSNIGLSIVCLINCWKFVNPERPMLLGLVCDDCRVAQVTDTVVDWTISDLQDASFYGETTQYFTVVDFGITTTSTFIVRVMLTYRTNSGQTGEVRLGKRYWIVNLLPDDLIDIYGFVTASKASSPNVSSELLANFQRYDVSLAKMSDMLPQLPLIVTVTMINEPGEVSDDSPILDHYVLLRTYWSPMDFCIESFARTKSSNYMISLELSTREGLRYFNLDNQMYMLRANHSVQHRNIDIENMWNFTQDPSFIVNDKTYLATISRAIQEALIYKAAMEQVNTTNASVTGMMSQECTFEAANASLNMTSSNSSEMASHNHSQISSIASPSMLVMESSILLVNVSASITSDKLLNVTAQSSVNTSQNVFSSSTSSTISHLITQDTTTIKAVTTQKPILLSSTANAKISTTNNLTSGPVPSQIENTSTVGQEKVEAEECENTTAMKENDGIKQSDTFVLKGLEDIVEKILNLMISDGENGLTYSNINLYLVTLIRMLGIRSYRLTILNSSIKLLANAHALHRTILEDPDSDSDLISLKFEALYALAVYMRHYPWETEEFEEMEYVTDIVSIINSILSNIPMRMPLRYPVKKIFTSKHYVASALWLDAFELTDDLILELDFTRLIISKRGLQYAAFTVSTGTFINLAVYSSRVSVLPDYYFDIRMISPVLFISIVPKQQTEGFEVSTPGIYNIRYDLRGKDPADFTSTTFNLSVYSRIQRGGNALQESDCYFFRIEASPYYASIINIRPRPTVKLGVRLGTSNKVSIGLKTIDSMEIILPNRGSYEKRCSGLATKGFGIFLPAVPLSQKTEIRSVLHYYIILRVTRSRQQTIQGVQIPSLKKIADERITMKCLTSACLTWSGTSYETKDCKVNACEGFRDFISCSCNQGQIFAAGVGPCDLHAINISRDKLDLQEFKAEDANYVIPTFIISLWLIFLSFIMIARRKDILERHLGKTFALDGVFSPYKGEQYLMCLVTGFGVNCGTKSVPYMTIIGTERVSPRYSLIAREYIFLSGTETWLLVSAPHDLGRPRRVILSLEPEYSEVSTWFVKELFIKDLNTEEEWTCQFNNWIPDKTNFSFPFLVADAIRKRSGGKGMFGPILLRLLRNHHPVFSIFYCVPGTNYTKVQHVIFCFCCIIFVMAVCFRIHKQPFPKLVGDDDNDGTYSKASYIYWGAIFSAVVTLIPTYFFERLLENAKQVTPNKTEWQPKIKQFSWNTDTSTGEENDKENQRKLSRKFSKFSVEVQENSSSSSTEQKKQGIFNKIRSCCGWICSLIFPLPKLVMLALASAYALSTSYNIFVLGFYYNTKESLDFLFMVCEGFILLMVVFYPLLLLLVALINTIFYIYGKSYYGITRESESRIKSFFVAMPTFIQMTKYFIFESPTKLLGGDKEKKVHLITMKRSNNWCKQLMLTKKAHTKKDFQYTTMESLLFIFVSVTIMNLTIGLLKHSFYQSSFMAKSLGVHMAESPGQDEPHTIDDVWDRLLKMFTTLQSWRTNTSLIYLEMSAVRVRQIRVKPYQGNCREDYPDLIQPRCSFYLKDSRLETRDFADSWNIPLGDRSMKPGPYSYKEGFITDVVNTPISQYPPGGYEILISKSSKHLEKLGYLRNDSWIDEYTKAIIVSMNLLNIDSGLISLIDNVYEFTPAGIFMQTGNLKTFKINRVPAFKFIVSCAIVIFSLMTVYFMIVEIKTCFEIGIVNYFKLWYSWCMLLERIVSFFIILVCLALGIEEDDRLIQMYRSVLIVDEHLDYVDFHGVAQFLTSFIYLNTIMVICSYVRVLFKFQGNLIFGIFVNMIPAVSRLMFIPMMFTMAFAWMGYLLFHALLKPYSRLGTAMGTVTVLMLETSTIVPTVEAAAVAGKLYIVSVYCVMFYIVLNFFIVMLNERYSELKRFERLHNYDRK